jgi:hypothetical protein
MWIGGTKLGEIERSCDIFNDIVKGLASHMSDGFDKNNIPELALAFIYDCQYGQKEIKMMLDSYEERRRLKRIVQKSNLIS